MSTDLGTDLLTLPEAAKLLKVSTVTLGRWLKDGRLPAYRVGPRAVRIRRQDLDAMLTPARPQATPAPRKEGSMTIEQFKQYVSIPPTPEELARRQAVLARVLEHRKDINIAPLTTADLIHRAREEEYESYGHGR
jgi:excisionase family DNA binding protein